LKLAKPGLVTGAGHAHCGSRELLPTCRGR
jgi:hypothetical protein